jgi:exonuclease VII small subunit
MSSQIDVRIKAIDEASKTIAEASKKIKKEMEGVEATNKRVVAAQKEAAKSSRDLIIGFNGVATSAFSLYTAFGSVGDAQLRIDRANLQVKTSHNSVENAQKSLNSAIEKYGVGSEEAEKAAASLEVAQDRYALAVSTAEDAQDSMNETLASVALQVIPTSITMVDGLSKAWKNLPDMSGLLTKISDGVGNIGVSAKSAAVGVGLFLGGFLALDSILSSIPDDMRAVAGALTATISAIISATVAWMAFHGTMTVGVAVPVILAAVGTGIAGVKAAVGMAKGGVIREPTLVLAGEAGPEIYSPLDKFENMMKSSGSSSQYVTIYPTINIGNISSDVDLLRVRETISYGIAEGVRRRLP